MDLVTVEVIPTTTILGPAMVIHLLVVTVALDHLTHKVEVKITLSLLMFRNWLGRTTLNVLKLFDLFCMAKVDWVFLQVIVPMPTRDQKSFAETGSIRSFLLRLKFFDCFYM